MIINTPLDYTEAEYIQFSEKPDENGVFWKQLIPMDYELNYKGRKLKFDKDYLSHIREAFKEKVYDQTAFQLANDNNEHDTKEDIDSGRNFDPRRFSGDIDDLAINNRGLFGKFKLTSDGLNLIKKNPKLGVSVSLKEGHEHNGKTYPVVMRHVLGTLDPKIKGMSPWTKDDILLSNTDGDEEEEVIDLTTAVSETDNGDEKVEVSKTEYEAMLAKVKEYDEGEKALNDILNESDEDDDENGNEENGRDESTPVGLSNEEDDDKVDPRYIQLSNKVAAAEWKAERAELKRKGVPNAMLNLAEDVMADGGENTINLSTETKVDGKELIRKMLHEAEGYIDLSEESGHGVTTDEHEKEKSNRDSFVDDFFTDIF